MQYPAFAPGSSEVAVRFFGFFVCFRFCFLPEFALTMPAQLFLVPYSFSVFPCWRRGVPRESIAAEGPRPVSFSLLKGPKVSPSETSFCWTGTTDPSLP